MSDEARTRRRPAVSDDAKLQRRDEIMAAAKKVFARSGFHATTIADIAKEADLAYGSVYQYFDSKDDLFHTLMSAEGYALRTHVAVALAATGEHPGGANRSAGHRRLITDDGVTAADVADFVIEFIGNGLRPRAAKAAELTAVADDLDEAVEP